MSETEHRLLHHRQRESGDWETACSCGAVWSQPDKGSSNATVHHLGSIFDSHVAYAKRQATKVD